MHLTFSENGLFEPRHWQFGLIVDLQAGAATLLQMPNKRSKIFSQIVINNTWLISDVHTSNIVVCSMANSALFIIYSRKKKLRYG